MQMHAACVAWLLAAKLGGLPAATAAVSGQQQCIRSLLPPNSTTSIRAPGSPTYWLALPIIRRRACMEPEDGCFTILDVDNDDAVTAFTAAGIENLREPLADLEKK